MSERGIILTNAGRALLARLVLGDYLHFTCAWTGDGELEEGQDPHELEHLIHPKRELEIHSLKLTEQFGTAELEMELHNIDMLEGYYVREYGLMAKNPDGGDDILYAYCNKGKDAPYLEAFNGTDPITLLLTFIAVVSEAPNVSANIIDKGGYVTHTRFNQRLMLFFREIDEMNQRVTSLTNALLELTRAVLWGTGDIIHIEKQIEEMQKSNDKLTVATLDLARSQTWDTANLIKTQLRLHALENGGSKT